MTQEPLSQLAGKLDELFAESGIQPRLKLSLNIINRNPCGFDLLAFRGRLHVQFAEGVRGNVSGLGLYVGEVERDSFTSVVNSGDANIFWLYCPISFAVFGELEQARTSRDVVIQMTATYTALERCPPGNAGNRVLAMDLLDPRGGSNGFLSLAVPRSQWTELLTSLGYSENLRVSRQTLLETVRDAQQAKQEAEEAARAAKDAATLTGVTTLSQAYFDEAANLNKTSRRWLSAGVAIATVTTVLMGFYVYWSFRQPAFTASQTIIRIAVLGVLFGGFGFCVRSYNAYQHLELLNRHRVNIGRTFETFKAAQPSDKAKDVLAAITADQMINFGRTNFPGKEPEPQLSLVTELIKGLIERPKS